MKHLLQILTKRLSSIIVLSIISLAILGCSENQNNKIETENHQAKDSNAARIEDEMIEESTSDDDTSWVIEGEDSMVVNIRLENNNISKNQKQLDQQDILRIEGIVSKSWKGVNGCCDENTINQQTQIAIEQWVGMQVLANRPHEYYRSGIVGNATQAKCSRKKDKWTNKRSCKGSYQQTYFIEFIKK